MKRMIAILVALAWVFSARNGLAQEKFTLKLKELGKGDSSRVERKEATANKTTATLEKQKEGKTQEYGDTKQFLYTDTILEQPEGAKTPTKIKRVYEKVVLEGAIGPFGNKASGATLNGQTVVIEKKGDAYEFRKTDGTELDKESNSVLKFEFANKNTNTLAKGLLPPGPVALNEPWKINSRELFGEMPKDDVQLRKSEGTAKLTKVYKKDGRLYGVIQGELELELTSTNPGDKVTPKMAMDMKGTMKMTFDGCIDGSVADFNVNSKMGMNVSATVQVAEVGAVKTSGLTTVDALYSFTELRKK